MRAPRPWLPERARRKELSEKALKLVRTKGRSTLEFVERFSRPRSPWLLSPLVLKVVAVVLALVGVVLVLPIPFMNSLPGVALILVGVGLSERDGLFVLAGTSLSVALLLALALFGRLLSQLPVLR